MEQRYGLRVLGDKNNDVDTRCVAFAAKRIGLHSPLVHDTSRGGEIKRKRIDVFVFISTIFLQYFCASIGTMTIQTATAWPNCSQLFRGS